MLGVDCRVTAWHRARRRAGWSMLLMLIAVSPACAQNPSTPPPSGERALGPAALAYADAIAPRGTAEHARAVRGLLGLLGRSATVFEQGARAAELIRPSAEALDTEILPADLSAAEEDALSKLLDTLGDIPDEVRAEVAAGAARLATPAVKAEGDTSQEDAILIATLAEIKTLPETRVYYGRRARLTFVGALLNPDDALICSGVLIAPDKVLTAAHCLCQREVDGGPIIPLQLAIFGPNTRRGEPAFIDAHPDAYRRTTECHPSRPLETRTRANGDLAIVRLTKSLPGLSDQLQLATGSQLHARGEVDVVGFGQNEHRVTKVQRTARMKVKSFDCAEAGAVSEYGCAAPIGGQPVDAVAADVAGADSCFGDSGGAVLLTDAAARAGPHLLIGIISRNPTEVNSQPCGGGTVFTRIDGGLHSWLTQALKDF